MHERVDVNSNETEDLIRFVATARRRRPEAWGCVERLKSACAPLPGRAPELNELVRRVRQLEHEIERLRTQSDGLQARLAQAEQQRMTTNRSTAANAGTYADSDNG